MGILLQSIFRMKLNTPNSIRASKKESTIKWAISTAKSPPRFSQAKISEGIWGNELSDYLIATIYDPELDHKIPLIKA